MKTLFTTLLMILTLTTQASFASSRTDELVNKDATDRLQKILELKNTIKKNDAALSILEKELLEEIIKADKQKTAKIVLAVGTVGMALSAAYIKMHGPRYGVMPDEAFLGLFGFVTSSVVTVSGGAKYLFNINDAEILLKKVRELKAANKMDERNLNKEIALLCVEDPRQELCY